MAVVYRKDVDLKGLKRSFEAGNETAQFNHHFQPKRQRRDNTAAFGLPGQKRGRDDFDVGMDWSTGGSKRPRECTGYPGQIDMQNGLFSSTVGASALPSHAIVKWQGQPLYVGHTGPSMKTNGLRPAGYSQHSVPLIQSGDDYPGFRMQNMRDYTPAPATTQLVVWRDPNNFFQRDEGKYEAYPP